MTKAREQTPFPFKAEIDNVHEASLVCKRYVCWVRRVKKR
jgi:hypothetical protein